MRKEKSTNLNMNPRSNRTKIIIGAFILCFPLALGLWLADKNLALRGSLNFAMSLAHPPRFMKGPDPVERVKLNSEGITLVASPVNIIVPRPRTFENAQITVWFDPRDTDVIETGVILSSYPWIARTATIFNRLFENLSWPSLRENGLTLWQRNPRFSSIQDFMANLPSINRIATSGVSVPHQIKIPGYVPRDTIKTYPLSARGNHTMFTYLGNGETLDMQFQFQDMNRHDDADPIAVELFDGQGKRIRRIEQVDDGEVWGSNVAGRPVLIRLHEALPSGAYEIRISASDDIFLRSLATSQSKVVFRRSLYLGDTTGWSARESTRPFTLYAAGSYFGFRTPHPQAAQTINLGSHEISINAEEKRFDFSLPTAEAWTPMPLTVSSDLQIITDGFIALEPLGYFLPEPIPANSRFDPDRLGIDYIIASYKAPEHRGSIWVGHATVPIYDLVGPGELAVLLGSPSLGAEGFTVSRMALRLERRVDLAGDLIKTVKYTGKGLRKLWKH